LGESVFRLACCRGNESSAQTRSGLQAGLTGVFRFIERWASESPERSQLLIVLIWVVFGVLVLVSTGIAAWILLPQDARPF
jgi:hypothetical protein